MVFWSVAPSFTTHVTENICVNSNLYRIALFKNTLKFGYSCQDVGYGVLRIYDYASIATANGFILEVKPHASYKALTVG